MSSIKKLAGQTALYGLSSILARAINFLLVPFYTKFMIPTVFGTLTEYMIYISFLLVVLTFGMETSYFRYAQEKQEEHKVFSQLLTYVFSWTLLICLAIYIGAPQLQGLIAKTGNQSYIELIAIIIFLDVTSALPFARLRNKNKPLKFVIIKISSVFINVFLNALFIWFIPEYLAQNSISCLGITLDLSDQVYCILLANVIANSIYILFFFEDFKLLFKHWNTQYMKPVFKYAYPIMILGLAGIVNEMIDRLMLKSILPDSFYSNLNLDNIGALGVYAANYKFAIFITLAIQAYRYAAEPFFFKNEKEKDSEKTFASLMTVFTVILLAMAVYISVFRQEIGFLLLGKEIYREGLIVVPILLFANVCVGIYYNLSAWYKLTDKTIYGTIIGIGGAIITVVLNYILIPNYGFMGCAIATLACYATMMIWSYILGQRHYPIPYEIRKIVMYFFVSTVVILISIFGLETLEYSFIYKIILSLVFTLFLYKMEFEKVLKA